MSNQVNSMNKGLTVKDLVTTGIFTALLFVFVLVGGVFFATNPVLTFFMPAGGGLLAGPIYLLLIAKVHKRWSLSIMGVIMGIIWFVTGMHWAFALGYMIMAIVADFVAGAGQYKSKKLNSLSYILFSLGGTGSYIVFFVDPNGWACEDIQYCVDHDLMNGIGNRKFAPKMVMTRAQMVQVLYNIVGEPAVTGETTFTDLTANWYQNAVLWAYQTGVASGMSETTFAPDDPVTREQVTVFLAEFADRVLDKYTPYMWDALFPFQDRESISYYARTAMNWACNLGLIKGIPGPGGLRLEPQSYATREQMAVILAQFCRELNVWNEPMPEL